MTDSQITITKQSGERERFDSNKLRQSLKNAKAAESCVEEIVSQVTTAIYPGMGTREIYRLAYRLLRKKTGNGALRYKLKEALMQLGPTGYPFEVFVGEIFLRLGYSINVGVVVKGACVSHEMDVIATKASEQLLIECKFARDQKTKQGIQTALYVNARVQDIVAHRETLSEFKNTVFKAAVFTNAHLTKDTIAYGECQGMELVGWDYPKKGGLRDLIEETNLFPITILSHLPKLQKQQLLEKGIVSCRDLIREFSILDDLRITERKKELLQRELQSLLNTKK